MVHPLLPPPSLSRLCPLSACSRSVLTGKPSHRSIVSSCSRSSAWNPWILLASPRCLPCLLACHSGCSSSLARRASSFLTSVTSWTGPLVVLVGRARPHTLPSFGLPPYAGLPSVPPSSCPLRPRAWISRSLPATSIACPHSLRHGLPSLLTSTVHHLAQGSEFPGHDVSAGANTSPKPSYCLFQAECQSRLAVTQRLCEGLHRSGRLAAYLLRLFRFEAGLFQHLSEVLESSLQSVVPFQCGTEILLDFRDPGVHRLDRLSV